MLPWLLVAVVLVAVAAAALYYWQTRQNIPQLTFTQLPPYEIPDVILISGVLVENRGRRPAPNIKIVIEFSGDPAPMIHHMYVAGSEPAVLRSGGERHTFANISAKQLRPRGKLVVYWAAAQNVQPRIEVTSYQPTQETFLSKLLPRKAEA
jgi:hypothetical protein